MTDLRASVRRHETALRAAAFRGLTLALALSPAGCQDDSKAVPPDAGADPCKPSLAGIYTGVVADAAECLAWQRHACGIPEDIHPLDGGCHFSVADCQRLCPSFGASSCRASDASCSGGVMTPGSAIVQCDFCVGGIGRRPEGLLDGSGPGSGVGAYLARMAHLEAASVFTFVELRRTLLALRAPHVLVDGATVAIQDERRHARKTAQLARRFGARPSPVRIRPRRETPSLERLATENAVEGEVMEAHGALVLAHAAARAEDAEVRDVFAELAGDELRHGALARAIADWLRPRLDRVARKRVDAARAAAFERVLEAPEPFAELRSALGLPGRAASALLADAVASTQGRAVAPVRASQAMGSSSKT